MAQKHTSEQLIVRRNKLARSQKENYGVLRKLDRQIRNLQKENN